MKVVLAAAPGSPRQVTPEILHVEPDEWVTQPARAARVEVCAAAPHGVRYRPLRMVSPEVEHLGRLQSEKPSVQAQLGFWMLRSAEGGRRGGSVRLRTLVRITP